jgi:tetratricopeptide (TPR) repeat protein
MIEYSSDYFSDAEDGAVQRFEDMLRANASYFFDVEELEGICDFFFDAGQHAKARKAIDHGLMLYPGSSALLLKKAHALLIVKQPKSALKILDFLEASEPTNTEMLLFKAVVHRNLSDHEGTKACLMKALETTTENQEEIFLDLAFEQEMVDDFQGAIQSLKQSLRINPHHEASLFELGYCFDMAEQVEKGVDFFNGFIDKYPYSFVAWYNLAVCYEKLGLCELAISAVDYCIAIKDDFTNAHVMRGNLFTVCEKDELAIEAYNDSLGYDAQNPMVYAAIGECHERLEDLLSAEINYAHALSIDNNHVEALMGMGAVREAQERMPEALAFYKSAADKDEFNLDNWHIYAETLVKAGFVYEAEGIYEEMTVRFADDEESWSALAEMHFIQMGAADALETINEALEHIPQSADLPWHLVKYLTLTGKPLQAEVIMTNALLRSEDGLEYLLGIFPEAAQYPNLASWFDSGIPSEPQQ